MKPIAWLIRHGDDGAGDYFVSWTDLELSAKGREQAEEVAEFLADKRIELVYSSPLIRSIQMAEPLGLPIIQHRGLLPWNRGILTGAPDDDDSKAALHLFVENPDVRIPLGESRRDCEERLTRFFGPAFRAAEHEPTVFFTHHSTIDVLNCLILGKRNAVPTNLVEKGGVVAVYLEGDEYRLEPVLHEAENEAGPTEEVHFS